MRDIAAEMRAYLEQNGPATVAQIALGIRARRADVQREATWGAFATAVRPEGANPRAVYYDLSRRVPPPASTKSRAAQMLEVLRDGRQHSRQEIFERVGRYFLTNNAASELRKQGYDVRSGVLGGVYVYWLEQPAAA